MNHLDIPLDRESSFMSGEQIINNTICDYKKQLLRYRVIEDDCRPHTEGHNKRTKAAAKLHQSYSDEEDRDCTTEPAVRTHRLCGDISKSLSNDSNVINQQIYKYNC